VALLVDGQIIKDTYEVERFLGEGAFAEVYRVKHRFLGRQAMKVFKFSGMSIQETEKLLSEALLLSKIPHPNIICVYDANVIETKIGTCGYFTMEYVAGGSLEKFWRSHAQNFVPVETSVTIMKQVCSGLAVAHSEKPPIIHRDVKPQNILVGYDANGIKARLSDFGLAKHVNPLTLFASAKGTRPFKAPEVFKDFKVDSCTGDIWALGCTIYLLLTDRYPFADLFETDVIEYADFEKPVIPPSRLNISVNQKLDEIILKTLALDPNDRYKNATHLLKDLNKWKPTKIENPKLSDGLADSTKTALGVHSPIDSKLAEDMVNKAMGMAKDYSLLNDAADLMEEAFMKSPELKDKYESILKLWRKGISNTKMY
jgi:eukaryotic-like serine/threonine-protein kinase